MQRRPVAVKETSIIIRDGIFRLYLIIACACYVREP
jgi:hypothetical protein